MDLQPVEHIVVWHRLAEEDPDELLVYANAYLKLARNANERILDWQESGGPEYLMERDKDLLVEYIRKLIYVARLIRNTRN